MTVDLYIKFIVGVLSTYAIVILNFAIFKIKIRGNDKQIAIIALCVGVTNVYMKFVVDSSNFIIAQSVVYILVLTLLRKYPLLYSTVIYVTGLIVVAFGEAFTQLALFKLNLMTVESLNENIIHFILLHTIVSIIFLLVALFLKKLNIGFSFITSKFRGRYFLKKSTYMWGILLVMATAIIQISTQKYRMYSINGIIMLVMFLLLIVVLVYSYLQNKKSLKARYLDEKEIGI